MTAYVVISPCPLHEEAMYVGPLPGRSSHFLLVLLGDLADQGHLVERQLVLPGGALHDGRQEGLRVEEAAQPHRRGQAEVRRPRLELLDAEDEVCVPARQPVEGGVGPLGPRRRDLQGQNRKSCNERSRKKVLLCLP